MWYKVAAIILGSHCVRYASEWLYWNHCAGFISSIFSYHSPSCIGLRWIADSVSTNMVAIVGTCAVSGIQMIASH